MRKGIVLSRNNIATYLLSGLIAIYIWRLNIFGNFLNFFLLIGLIAGIIKNGWYFMHPSYFGSKLFYFIIIGILISFLLAAYFRGSIAEQIKLNSVYTALRLRRILEGLMLFLLIVLNVNSKYKLIKLLNALLYINVFFALLMILRISDNFVSLFGIEPYNITVYQVTLGVETIRRSFATLDAGSFGGIMAVFAVYSLFKYSTDNKRHIIYIIFIIIFSTAASMTVSRTVVIRFVFSLLIYAYFSYRINLRTLLISIIITITVLIIISETIIGNSIFIRFTEIFYNLRELVNEKELVARDSFQYRIVRSLYGVPDNTLGWIFGTGGIQTARIGQSCDHIEYTNWLWQYGLITFIPFILYFVSQIRILFRLNRRTNNKLTKHLTAFGLSIIIGIMLGMVAAPQFYFLWIWLAFSVVIINISLKIYQQKTV
jgi:hypothetical protein